MARPAMLATIVAARAVAGAAAAAAPAVLTAVSTRMILAEALTESGTAYVTDLLMGLLTPGPVLATSAGSVLAAQTSATVGLVSGGGKQ
jgi:hypothetical protein